MSKSLAIAVLCLGALILILLVGGCSDEPPVTPVSTTTSTPTQEPAETAAPTPTPAPTIVPPTSTPVPTATPAPTATSEPTATPSPTATPEPTAEFDLKIDSGTTWQDVFDAFAPSEQDCIRGNSDSDTLGAYLDAPVLSALFGGVDTTEWDQAVYSCVAPDTAHGLHYTLTVAFLDELGAWIGVQELREEEKSCLRGWSAGLDLAVLAVEDPDGDFNAEAFACTPDLFISMFIGGLAAGAGWEWTVSDEERTCLREWIADADMTAVFADFDGVEPGSYIESLEGLYTCVPDLLLNMALPEGTQLWELTEAEETCLRQEAVYVDWAGFFAAGYEDRDDPAEIAKLVPELVACAPQVFGEGEEPVPPGSTDSVASDRAALVALYNATGGANWSVRDNWLSDEPLDKWHGVTVDADGRVTVLDFTANLLTGEIPAELGELEKLTELWLWSNDLSGEIPPELGRLSNLEVLYLSLNQLSGEIPSELGRLSSLEVLLLDGNDLSGEIPPELGNLDKLVWLMLAGNRLTGCVPARLGEIQIVVNDIDELDLPFCSQTTTDRASADLGTRENPVPFGSTFEVNNGATDHWNITVLNTTPDATRDVLAENPNNVAPEDGHQFLIASVRATYLGAGSQNFDAIFRLRLRAIGGSGDVYTAFDDFCGVIPSAIESYTDLSAQQSVEGNVCWKVPTDDVDSLVMSLVSDDYLDESRFWFFLR